MSYTVRKIVKVRAHIRHRRAVLILHFVQWVFMWSESISLYVVSVLDIWNAEVSESSSVQSVCLQCCMRFSYFIIGSFLEYLSSNCVSAVIVAHMFGMQDV